MSLIILHPFFTLFPTHPHHLPLPHSQHTSSYSHLIDVRSHLLDMGHQGLHQTRIAHTDQPIHNKVRQSSAHCTWKVSTLWQLLANKETHSGPKASGDTAQRPYNADGSRKAVRKMHCCQGNYQLHHTIPLSHTSPLGETVR